MQVLEFAESAASKSALWTSPMLDFLISFHTRLIPYLINETNLLGQLSVSFVDKSGLPLYFFNNFKMIIKLSNFKTFD